MLNRLRLNKRVYSYLLLLLLWWVIGCEFEVPTLPRLPARWNSKLILPLLHKTYWFADLIADPSDSTANPIYARSDSQMYYFKVDSSEQTIKISPDYRKIPTLTISKSIRLASAIKAAVNQPVPFYRTNLGREINQENNEVIFGQLNSDAGTANFIQINALLVGDTLPNEIEIGIVAHNFKNHLLDTLWVDTLTIPLDSTEGTLTLNVAQDSLISRDRSTVLDSLTFEFAIQIKDTLRERLSQTLQLSVEIGELHLDSFYGRAKANGYLNPLVFKNNPPGASNILFDSAMVDFSLGTFGDFDSVDFRIIGVKRFTAETSVNSSFDLVSSSYRVAIPTIMANLPDSIKFNIEASLPLNTYDGSLDLNAVAHQLTIDTCSVWAPLRIMVRDTIRMRAAQPTRFFIADSLTRAKIVNSQDGAEFDIYVTNQTPFAGSICLLIGNYDFFPSDTTELEWNNNYQYINDTLYYIAADTQRVTIDTLALFDLPLPGAVGEQYFMADSSALGLLGDTCYFLPKFVISCADTNAIRLKTSYAIDIKSYLNLLFDATVFNQSVEDTTQ